MTSREQRLEDALIFVEDILSFHEGIVSEEVTHPGGEPVVWINATDPHGDFQTMLMKIRDALKVRK